MQLTVPACLSVAAVDDLLVTACISLYVQMFHQSHWRLNNSDSHWCISRFVVHWAVPYHILAFAGGQSSKIAWPNLSAESITVKSSMFWTNESKIKNNHVLNAWKLDCPIWYEIVAKSIAMNFIVCRKQILQKTSLLVCKRKTSSWNCEIVEKREEAAWHMYVKEYIFLIICQRRGRACPGDPRDIV